MSIPHSGRLFALDWGQRRIGLARSDDSQILASPLPTLLRRDGKRFPMPPFLALVKEYEPVGLVIGLPISLEGAETPSSRAARELADLVGRRTGLPCDLWDERLSSVIANDAIRGLGGSSRDDRARVDALAASILLQHYLDARRGSSVQ